MNKSIISGNLGQDAIVRPTEDGRQYLQFSVAVNEGKNADGSTRVTWFNCSDWNEKRINSTLKDHLKSGTKVLLVGKYVPQIWQRTIEGVPQPHEISHGFLVNEIELCGGGSQGSAFTQQPVPQPQNNSTSQNTPIANAGAEALANTSFQQSETAPVADDDLPF